MKVYSYNEWISDGKPKLKCAIDYAKSRHKFLDQYIYTVFRQFVKTTNGFQRLGTNITHAFLIKEFDNLCGYRTISKKTNIDRNHLQAVARLLNFKTPFHVQKEANKRRQLEFTSVGQQIILGSFLGDGHISSNCEFVVSHCDKQKEYLFWKYKNLQNNVNHKPKKVAWNGGTNNRDHRLVGWSFRTIKHDKLASLESLYTRNDGRRIKTVSRELLSELNDIGLAVWFMDDGSSQIPRKNTRPLSRFYTNAFSVEDINILQECLLGKWGIHSKRCSYRGKEILIHLNSDNTSILFSIIGDIVNSISCMRGKIK